VADVFLSQGYENPRMNIHKTGREIDLKARHRLEDKVAVAECKAQKRPIGGDALNKFAGALERERVVADGTTTQGYFISLSGFRESAREQEEEGKSSRFILLDGQDVQQQLVVSGMVVSPEEACETVGRLASNHKITSSLVAPPQLLAHALGWMWLCVFGQDHELTHFTLVHADGRPLGQGPAQKIIDADKEDGGKLSEFTYFGPQADAADQSAIAGAEEKYKAYLRSELGQITLEGLPADEEVGARHIALEDLYVPLKLEKAIEERRRTEDSSGGSTQSPSKESGDDAVGQVVDKDELEADLDGEDPEKETLGSVLARDRRLAILAAPGAGKSTLIKRLAVAYAHPESRSLLGDDLPDAPWLPVFIRCRTLGAAAREPIWNVLDELPNWGEFPDCAAGFHELVARSLREGNVLLLIDGLDEISDQGERLAFVRQLRTFLGTYPNVGLVLTSRERGFRAVAGAMSSMCEWYKLAEFENDDIRSLTRAWHVTVVGQSVKVEKDAEALASTIIETDRVRRLAKNPLLLTTLLLVKRWVGALPRKRTVLYEKAIEVLLMTWNVEAHEPIDREEAIPQLAFVAHAMTERGDQSLSSVTLAKLLGAAREQMPEILGFAQTSVSQFVDQIENRSSLLVMTGHVEEAGALVPNYEFRHLTFQEYLTAVALVEGFYEGHKPSDSLASQLSPHFKDPEWLEVITLANVRAGRGASEVVSELIQRLEGSLDKTMQSEVQSEAEILGRGLADEVQLPPALVKASARALGRFRSATIRDELLHEIMQGRYGKMYQDVVEAAYYEDQDPQFAEYGGAVASLVEISDGSSTLADEGRVEYVTSLLSSSDERKVTEGALLAMEMVFRSRLPEVERQVLTSSPARGWPVTMISLAEEGRPSLSYAAAWALVWLSQLGITDPSEVSRGLHVMVDLWQRTSSALVEKQAAWACISLPGVDRAEKPLGDPSPELCKFIEEQARLGEKENGWREDRGPAALLLAYYLGAPWDEEELAEKARTLPGVRGSVLDRLL
jgi:hypothetical protein